MRPVPGVHRARPMACKPRQKIWGYETSWAGRFRAIQKGQAQQAFFLEEAESTSIGSAPSYGLTYFTEYGCWCTLGR